MSGYLPPDLPYPWEPDGARPLRRGRPAAGTLLPLRHEVWRVVEIRDYPADLQDADDPKYHIVLRPARHGDDARDRDHDVSLSVRLHRTWYVYEDDHYPVCAVCGEPTPCRDTMARRTADQAAKASAAVEARAEFGCMACGEMVTTRQKAIVFEGVNLEAPTLSSPVFHLRADCHWRAVQYERKWVPAGPGRPWRLQCPGKTERHADAWDCTEGEACPGAELDHAEKRWCDGHGGVVGTGQRFPCVRCVDARAAGLVATSLPGDPRPRRRRRPAKPTAPAGYSVPAAKLGAVVHITDANRPEYPKPKKLPGRAVVAQYAPGTVLGWTVCGLAMLIDEIWVGYRGDPAADGSLCGDCGKHAGVAVDQREAS